MLRYTVSQHQPALSTIHPLFRTYEFYRNISYEWMRTSPLIYLICLRHIFISSPAWIYILIQKKIEAKMPLFIRTKNVLIVHDTSFQVDKIDFLTISYLVAITMSNTTFPSITRKLVCLNDRQYRIVIEIVGINWLRKWMTVGERQQEVHDMVPALRMKRKRKPKILAN